MQDLTAAQAKTLGKQADAEVVIIGKAVAKLYGDVGGGHEVGPGRPLGKSGPDGHGPGHRDDHDQHAAACISPTSAPGTEALKKAANLAADEMMTKILAVYSQGSGRHAAGHDHDHRPEQDAVRKVQGCAQEPGARHQGPARAELQRNSTAKISVDSKTSAQQLSDELVLKDFGTFCVEVVSSTANTLELKVAPK